jgi:hypothetical protein
MLTVPPLWVLPGSRSPLFFQFVSSTTPHVGVDAEFGGSGVWSRKLTRAKAGADGLIAGCGSRWKLYSQRLVYRLELKLEL